MPPEKPLRLHDMNIGDWWLMDDPIRLIRVESKENIDRGVGGSDAVVSVSALRVRATVPGFEIPGLIDSIQADKGRAINASVELACRRSGHSPPDTEWIEVYAERMAHPVKSGAFGPYVDDRSPTRPQLYCLRTEGRHGTRDAKHRHMMARGQLAGVKVDPSALPAQVFRDDRPPKQKDPPKSKGAS